MSRPSYSPSLDELRAAGPAGQSARISREIPADLDTPVSAFLKLRGSGSGFLLESAEGGERIGRYSFIGVRPRRVLRVKGGQCWFEGETPVPCWDPLDAVRMMVDTHGDADSAQAPFEGGALGYLSYEAVRAFERVPDAACNPLGLPDAAFFDVDTVLVFDHIARRARIVSQLRLDGSLDDAYQNTVDRIEAIAQCLARPLHDAPAPPEEGAFSATCRQDNVTREQYMDMVRRAKEHISAGDILQVVLAHRLTLPAPYNPFGLYRRLRVVSPAPYMYFLDFGDHQIVGASPELLVQVKNGMVSTRPIAGTRPRGPTPEEDDLLAADLLADEKERAEHLMLVDLARNDVGRVSVPGSVRVKDFMQVERFSHVMHLVSDVDGRLRPECDAYDALRAAFPAGTVSGAPKIRAMEIIAQQERDRRGPYAGAVGFITPGGDMEMAITIRTGVVKDGKLHLQVGAGIVADSIPEREWEETMNKGRALLTAAGAWR